MSPWKVRTVFVAAQLLPRLRVRGIPEPLDAGQLLVEELLYGEAGDAVEEERELRIGQLFFS